MLSIISLPDDPISTSFLGPTRLDSISHYFSFQPISHSLGRIFVSPQASSEFESKMGVAAKLRSRAPKRKRLHCRLTVFSNKQRILWPRHTKPEKLELATITGSGKSHYNHEVLVPVQSRSQGLFSEERPWKRGWFSTTSVFKMSLVHTKRKSRRFQITPVWRTFSR